MTNLIGYLELAGLMLMLFIAIVVLSEVFGNAYKKKRIKNLEAEVERKNAVIRTLQDQAMQKNKIIADNITELQQIRRHLHGN